METAGTIAADDPAQERTFHTKEDEDWLQVELTAGKTYQIQTHFLSIPTNPLIMLFNSELYPIALIDNSDGDGYPLLNFECETSGTYFILVLNMSYQVGDYSIDVATVAPD